MICPPDVLCKWIPQCNRWETMEELAVALEYESLNTIDGKPFLPAPIGRPKVNLPRPIVQRVPSEYEKAIAALKRSQKNRLQATYKIERMMSLACPKRKRYSA
jgi:hypothetical protein